MRSRGQANESTAAAHKECDNQSTEATQAEEIAPLPFNLKDVRDTIPQHCFRISTAVSIGYFVRDIAIIGLLYWLRPYFLMSFATRFIWWNLVGFFGWALFVVGHDCGHGTFSSSTLINNIFGHLAHTPLLVPFHSWRISHREHHRYHNHVEMDKSWRPLTKKVFDRMNGVQKFFRFSLAGLFMYPGYLFTNLFDGNHYNPWTSLFPQKERTGVIISVASCLAWIAYLLLSFDFLLLVDAYFVPWVITCVWLAGVTYLQHTDAAATYYRSPEWTFLKGALSTIDRNYGAVINHFHHNIGDRHVVHHLFFTGIPHYHLVDATEAIKPFLGKHYMYDPTPIWTALMKSMRECLFVADSGQVLKYEYEESTSTSPAMSKKGLDNSDSMKKPYGG